MCKIFQRVPPSPPHALGKVVIHLEPTRLTSYLSPLHSSPSLHRYTLHSSSTTFYRYTIFSYVRNLSLIVPSAWHSGTQNHMHLAAHSWLFKTQLKAFLQKAITQAQYHAPFICSNCTVYKQIPLRTLSYKVLQKIGRKQLQTSYTLITAPIDLHSAKCTKKNPRRVLEKTMSQPVIQIIEVEEFTLENRIQMLAKDPCTSESLLLFLVYFQNAVLSC